ncbi:MAG: CPBP family intramembrane glutamic endopeptidase [Pseudomonadota bacterium]
MASNILLGSSAWLAPGRYRWLRAILWLLLLAALCIAAFNVTADASLWLAAILSGGEFTTRAAAPTGARLIAVIVGSIAMLATYALGVRLVERRPTPEIALRPMIPDLAIGLTVGGLLIVAIILPMWTAGWLTISATPITRIGEAVKQAIQSGVIEEVLMRLIVFRLLWRAAGAVPALVLTGLLFGALHLTNPDATWFAALCLTAGEGVGIGLYLLSGRIWMSIGMHASWNFVQGWVFGCVVSGLAYFPGGPLQTRPVAGVSSFLSGGGFGPESSLSALIVSLLGSGVFLWLAWKRGRFVAADE